MRFTRPTALATAAVLPLGMSAASAERPADTGRPDTYELAADPVAEGSDGWEANEWADGSDLITPQEGFNLGGIVLSPDRSAFVVAQGTTGRLWRLDTRSGAVTEIHTGGADLGNADGLVRSGRDLP